MEVSSYTSNVQPYGSQSGTKFASENENARHVSLSKDSERVDNVAEQPNKRQAESIDDVMKMAKERAHLSEKQRAQVVEQMHEFVSSLNKGLSFRVDEESGRDVVTVYEAETGDVIRQIPEEEMLKVLRRLAEEQDHRSGLLMTKV
ncbi:flagellar protein FlaG [Vibrio sp. PP-XX7]